MLRLSLAGKPDSPLHVLCLGAHADDIEIGCAGTLLKLARDHSDLAVDWVVLSADGERREEVRASARILLASLRRVEVHVERFRDGYFPYVGAEIKDYFEGLKRQLAPDLILTHCRSDLHQDHRLVCELTWNTFRDHWILEYEIPKYDGDLGAPNAYVHLDRQLALAKARHIVATYSSQLNRDWFTEETFLSLMRLRGIESRSRSGYAEAFYCRKMVL